MTLWYILAAASSLLIVSALVVMLDVPSVLSYGWVLPGIVVLAITASVLASMVGLGGGLIIVPVLVFVGLPPHVAAANSLMATMSNAAAASLVYSKARKIDHRHALRLGIMASPGSVLGALVTTNTDHGLFGILLALVLVIAAVYIFVQPRMTHRPIESDNMVLVLTAVASVAAGLVSSYFGIGGGVVFVPYLVVIVGMSMTRAAPTSMFALLITSVVGITTHTILGNADILLASLLSAGALVGGMGGARLAALVNERYLRGGAAIAMVTISGQLLWDAVYGEL